MTKTSKLALAQVLYDTWMMCDTAYGRQNGWFHHFIKIGDHETAKLAKEWRDDWKNQATIARQRYDDFCSTIGSPTSD